MQSAIVVEMNQIVDEYVEQEAFNVLLKSFITVKAAEKTQWSDITQAAHYMFAGSSPHIERLAALTEMMILALDIMDDLQDQDNMDILWMTCPQGYTLNAVVALLMAVIGEASRLAEPGIDGIPPCPQEISRILMKALSGQYKDLAYSIVTEDDYVEMIQEKSGSLIRLAFYMGYGSTAISAADRESMNQLAYWVGAIAQIENDIQDILRFDLKNDLLHKKKTLPILFLLAEPEPDFPIIQEFYADKLTKEQFLLKKNECIAYIKNSGCIDYAQMIQQLYRDEAQLLLNSIHGDSQWKVKLAKISLMLA